jgi:predicted transcriptional regulator
MPPPPPIEPAKSKIPDFAKPAEDERYFKQLKRF